MTDRTITKRVLQVEHVRMETNKKFADVAAALEAGVLQLDPAIAEALAHGDEHGRPSWSVERRFLFF